ncbi:hypothetical protein SLS57_004659 [Botryosphaeria dothidea]
MSWSAPSAGSAPPYQAAPPYAQQPYAQHPPYGQPPYPHTLYQQSAPPQSQPASPISRDTKDTSSHPKVISQDGNHHLVIPRLKDISSKDTQAVPEAQRLYQSEAYTINLGLDEWDQTDFDGAIWPKANEPVEPDFSLGVITWHPANEITLALPSDFNKAEEVAAEPAPPKIGNGDAVSKYFAPDNAHEAFLDVRQTDEWDSVKHDSIFYEFPKASDIVALEDVLANRDRPDPEGENPYPSIEENRGRDGREDSDWNVMDNLEQALSSEQPAGDSTESGNNRSTPTPVSRDDAQEALLASLGVTGSPKPVKPLPSPAHLPPHPQKGSKRGSTDNDR